MINRFADDCIDPQRTSIIHRLFPHSQVLAVTSAHLVTMETLGRRVGGVSPVSATTTLTCWTQTPATPGRASVCSASTTAKARPARAADWVTMATPPCRTVEVRRPGGQIKSTGLITDQSFRCSLKVLSFLGNVWFLFRVCLQPPGQRAFHLCLPPRLSVRPQQRSVSLPAKCDRSALQSVHSQHLEHGERWRLRAVQLPPRSLVWAVLQRGELNASNYSPPDLIPEET